MKSRTLLTGFTAIFMLSLLLSGCSQSLKKSYSIRNIENTLKSVSLFYDSTGVNPSELISFLERMNKAIDSIGYPDAGYKLWVVQSDTSKDYRFMVEGYWPDQAAYDLIHNHELYKNASQGEDETVWKNLKNITYKRFVLVK